MNAKVTLNEIIPSCSPGVACERQWWAAGPGRGGAGDVERDGRQETPQEDAL